ncbi:hypothetical protein MA16_Dca007963 [Dendrobium catenatum]|uniref:Uncharacterized protein n=1 Tax=Dendrobium catenatum TaxID=906689 RepID=A0A2I0XJE2_9ASPA|nr:hypothetical protein MA16_Dca007963 [Dendrobium catenatum]
MDNNSRTKASFERLLYCFLKQLFRTKVEIFVFKSCFKKQQKNRGSLNSRMSEHAGCKRPRG